MEQDLFEKAMKKLLDVKNEDKEDFLHDLELTISQLCSDVDQELKTLTSLSDTNNDFSPEIDNRLNWLRQVHDKSNTVNSAVDNLGNWLIDAKLRTSELTDNLAERLQSQEGYFHRAPVYFSDETLKANIRALSEVIDGDDQQICDDKIFVNDFKIRITEVASCDGICTWIPQFNDLLAEAREIKEVIYATEDEITKIDEQLKKFAE